MTYWLYRAIALLPLPIKYGLSTLAAFLLRRVFRYRAAVIDKNLQAAFPEQDTAWRNDIAGRFYQQFTDVAVEILHASRMRLDDFKHRVTVEGLDELERVSARRSQSVIVLTIHLGNWEWMMHAANAHGNLPIDPVYRRLHSKGADRFAYEVRSRFGGEPILMEKVARNVLRNRRRFRALVLVADQSPGERDNVYWTQWLNQPTAFFTGPATIAHLTDFPVMFARCRRKSRGRYHMSLIPLTQTPGQLTAEEIIEAYIREAEQAIREEPESFLWSNRRWKHRPPNQLA
ncbi:MAG: lysophospholipid acyltransferase family protein [Luminiphilus sp.]|nr:lysophospholipid acyltransferase family protein [Luminiphilus sp.]